MKKVLSVLAIAALFVVSFSSCGGNEKTATELLTQKNGWVLSSATSSPDYLMSDGSYAGDLINDGYLYDFETAYIIAFNENGSEIVKPGKVTAADDFEGDAYRAETSLGNWSFDNADKPEYISMQVPFFYDEDVEKCQVLALTEDEFRIKCTINDDSPVSKGTYSFTLTYVPAK